MIAGNSQRQTERGTKIPLIKGWLERGTDQLVVLEHPSRELMIGVFEADAERASMPVAEAWLHFHPGFNRPVDRELHPPPARGLDESVMITYGAGGSDDRVFFAVAKRKNAHTVVAMIEATRAALDRLAAEVDSIVGGIRLPGTQEEDLSRAVARPFDAGLGAELDRFVAKALARAAVPGAAVAIVQNGSVVWSGGFGLRELGGSEPVTADTLMLTGSTTKSLTTLLLATLVDEGRLSWDMPVRAILPEFQLADARVTEATTVRHLVCACTGLPRRDLELIFEFAGSSPSSLLASVANLAPSTALGETFQYSNQLVAIAGYLAGRAVAPIGELGDGYDRALQSRVLDPIGMSATTVSFDRALSMTNRASPHGRTLTEQPVPIDVELERFTVPLRPSAGAWSTAHDLALQLLTELGGGVAQAGNRVASAAETERRWQPQVPTSDQGMYGLGWGIRQDRGVRCIQHAGDTLGFGSLLAFYPDHGLGLVVLTNVQAPSAFRNAVRDRLFELVFGAEPRADEVLEWTLDTRAETLRRSQAGTDVPPETSWLQPFLGRWREPSLGEAEIGLSGNVPWLDAGEWRSRAARLRPDRTRTLLLLSEPPTAGLALLLTQRDGRPALVIDAGQHEYVFVPVEEPARP